MELLVVIVIIGVLAGLILPAVSSIQRSARRTECRNNQQYHQRLRKRFLDRVGLGKWSD